MKFVLFGLVLILIGLGQADVSSAFERRQFRVHGYVQWIAGEKLMLLADNGASIEWAACAAAEVVAGAEEPDARCF